MAYRFDGKQNLLSFGQYPEVSLSDVREARQKSRELLAKGIDPSQEKKEATAQIKAQALQQKNTFRLVAQEWFEKYQTQLSPKHADKLRRYLNNRLFPLIGHRLIDDLAPPDFLMIVQESERLGHHEIAHKLMNLCVRSCVTKGLQVV